MWRLVIVALLILGCGDPTVEPGMVLERGHKEAHYTEDSYFDSEGNWRCCRSTYHPERWWLVVQTIPEAGARIDPNGIREHVIDVSQDTWNAYPIGTRCAVSYGLLHLTRLLPEPKIEG